MNQVAHVLVRDRAVAELAGGEVAQGELRRLARVRADLEAGVPDHDLADLHRARGGAVARRRELQGVAVGVGEHEAVPPVLAAGEGHVAVARVHRTAVSARAVCADRTDREESIKRTGETKLSVVSSSIL